MVGSNPVYLTPFVNGHRKPLDYKDISFIKEVQWKMVKTELNHNGKT